MVELINKLDKEHNSRSSIKIEDEIIPLTEKELQKFVESIYNARPDVFENIPCTDKQELNKLKDDYQTLKEDYENLQREYEDLQNEYNEKEWEFEDDEDEE